MYVEYPSQSSLYMTPRKQCELEYRVIYYSDLGRELESYDGRSTQYDCEYDELSVSV